MTTRNLLFVATAWVSGAILAATATVIINTRRHPSS